MLEVMIASAVLVAAVLIAFRVLSSSQSLYGEAAVAQDLEERGRRFLDHYKKELMFCRITGLASDGAWIRYQVQLTGYDILGNFTLPAQQYGQTYNGDQPNWEYELAFVPTRIYLESAGATAPPGVSAPVETLAGIDMNGDGDVSDAFVQGNIEQRIYDSSGILRDVSRPDGFVILTGGGGGLAGDVDNDGDADGLFTVLDLAGGVVPPGSIAASGVKMRVGLWHGDFNESKTRFVLRNLKDEWKFRNPQ